MHERDTIKCCDMDTTKFLDNRDKYQNKHS